MAQPSPQELYEQHRDDFQEFRELMQVYEGLRSMITEDMIPYERYSDEQMAVPRMDAELERHEKRLEELKSKYPDAYNAPDSTTTLGQTILDAIYHKGVLEQRKTDAITKWGYFVAIVDKIVSCKYQMQNYTPVVFDASGLQREGIVYYDSVKGTVVVTHPLRVAQCTLKQLLLNGPFRKG